MQQDDPRIHLICDNHHHLLVCSLSHVGYVGIITIWDGTLEIQGYLRTVVDKERLKLISRRRSGAP